MKQLVKRVAGKTFPAGMGPAGNGRWKSGGETGESQRSTAPSSSCSRARTAFTSLSASASVRVWSSWRSFRAKATLFLSSGMGLAGVDVEELDLLDQPVAATADAVLQVGRPGCPGHRPRRCPFHSGELGQGTIADGCGPGPQQGVEVDFRCEHGLLHVVVFAHQGVNLAHNAHYGAVDREDSAAAPGDRRGCGGRQCT